ncbi:MAG: hypothetical protein EKK29_13925 [Hyphomicrobiales bacterium]|nr:MAG: hypothetical protein EKK29_13925 [Hyphomicrobiales bacterium]
MLETLGIFAKTAIEAVVSPLRRHSPFWACDVAKWLSIDVFRSRINPDRSSRSGASKSEGLSMKKLFLVPAVVALSTSFAFADTVTTSSTQSSGAASGASPLAPLAQALLLNQKIGNTSEGGFALNKAFIVQAQVPVNAGAKSSLSQKIDLSQTIGDTSKGGEAINKATVIQAQVPLNFGAP